VFIFPPQFFTVVSFFPSTVNLTMPGHNITKTTVLSGACFITLLVSLSVLYHHTYQSPVSGTCFQRYSSLKSSQPHRPNTLVDRLLILLPKDRSTEHDYGFHDDWLEKVIGNRKDYADYHGNPLTAVNMGAER